MTYYRKPLKVIESVPKHDDKRDVCTYIISKSSSNSLLQYSRFLQFKLRSKTSVRGKFYSIYYSVR